MFPVLETSGVALLAALGFLAGTLVSRLRSPYWLLGFFLPLLVTASIFAARRWPRVEFIPPFNYLMAGRTEYALTGLAAATLLSTPLSRLKIRRQRILVVIFAIVFITHSALAPFFMPIVVRGKLASLQTCIDDNGVCIQQTSYTCGPAAAVTALRTLGLPAEEGPLAILLHTNPASGTDADVLADLLNRQYVSSGLRCQYRYFSAVSDLPKDTPSIAVIRYGLFVDHFVTVLKVTPGYVIIADPLEGKLAYSHTQFAQMWRCAAVTLRK